MLISLILRSGPQDRVSKDEAAAVAAPILRDAAFAEAPAGYSG
jgi:hypothetical protein